MTRGSIGKQFWKKEIQKNFEKSISIVEQNKLYDKNLILVANKSFHHGVLGIVASKIWIDIINRLS